jgi:hypothetical protein
MRPAGSPNWFFPFRLKALAWHTAPHRWRWQHSRHMPRSWRLIRAQQFTPSTTSDGEKDG